MRGLRLLTKAILTTFAKTVYVNQTRTYRLWLVSPWIGEDDAGADALSILIEALRGRRCDVIVITRPPKEVWHSRAVDTLEKHTHAVVYHCPSLHTKLYVAECDGFRAAVLGSPNLTSPGNRMNREIAVEFRTTMSSSDYEVAAIINDLTDYASALRGERDVSLKS